MLSPLRAVARLKVLQAPSVPSLEEIERRLLDLANRERAAQRLPALHLSIDLVRLARGQSFDMARLNRLMHLSASGRPLTERLADADILFAANGENVARSETFVPDFIHQSFMESPGHRENILNPEFDEAGIGVLRGKEGVYFITEDFVRGLVRRDENEARTLVLAVLNNSRQGKGLPLLVPLDVLTETAKDFALSRASGKPLPQVPAFFGEAFVHFAIGAELTQLAEAIAGKAEARPDRVGVSVRFGRDRDYPGGAYWVCVILVGGGSPPGRIDLDRTLSVLTAANAIRDEKFHSRLELDQRLFTKADEILSLHRQGRTPDRTFGAPAVWYFYLTSPGNPGGIPEEGRRLIGHPAFRRIGISTQSILTKDGTEVSLAVVFVLDR